MGKPAEPPARPESAPVGKGKKGGDKVPAYLQQPFQKQITRVQAINGKLLEDNTMVRVLRGTSSNDIVYDPKFSAQSHAHNLGAVRRFGDLVGRLPLDKAGTRAAAQGTFPSHWRPSAPPNDSITRPGSASCGVAFQRQITRKQDVNGKLLENIAMTRFLFGTSGTGPENYDGAWDSMMKPLKVSHLKKIGPGQHIFGKQTGRLPLNRVGTRAAADGVFPSHWEPGMGYSETMNNEGKSVANFSKQPGRIELHLSGMRGAPPKASLAADYQGPETSARPQSAMAVLRGDTGAAPGAKKRPAVDASMHRPTPEGPRKNIVCHSFAKQLTRVQWASRPIR